MVVIDKLRESRMAKGRVAVFVPGHPAANNRGYILRARHVVECDLGRRLATEEHVHHIDGNPINDVLENLEVLSISEHTKLHAPWRFNRKLDYDLLAELRMRGLGYKRIAKATGYPLSSVKSAVRIIEQEGGEQARLGVKG